MSVRESAMSGNVTFEHCVRFFDTEESRIASVAVFLAEGYERKCPLIAVLRPRVWIGVKTALASHGVPVESLVAQRELTVLDATETLHRLSGREGPQQARFEKTVGSMVRGFGRQVYAYGEVVDLLAQRTDLKEALELEGQWNSLARQVPLTLMCGYSSAHFVSPSTQRALVEICHAHTRVEMKSQDQLGSWLLSGAGLLSTSSH